MLNLALPADLTGRQGMAFRRQGLFDVVAHGEEC